MEAVLPSRPCRCWSLMLDRLSVQVAEVTALMWHGCMPASTCRPNSLSLSQAVVLPGQYTGTLVHLKCMPAGTVPLMQMQAHKAGGSCQMLESISHVCVRLIAAVR